MAEGMSEGTSLSSSVSTKVYNRPLLNKLERLTKKDAKVLRYRRRRQFRSWEDYKNFVNRVDSWYQKNEKIYFRYMSLYAREMLSGSEFKLAIRDLKTPFSETEIDLIYHLMRPSNAGLVDYAKFYESIWITLADKFVADGDLKKLDLDSNDRWILLTFKVPSCEPYDMPTTFEHLVELSYTGTMLRAIIETRVPNLPTRAIVVFTDVSRYAETTVHCNQRLYEFPYVGGPKCAPGEAVIYYEFSMGRIDCPLLCHMTSMKELLNKKACLSSEVSVHSGYVSPAY